MLNVSLYSVQNSIVNLYVMYIIPTNNSLCFTTVFNWGISLWAKPQQYWSDKIYWSQRLISANHYYASGVITVKIKLEICIQLVWLLIEMGRLN